MMMMTAAAALSPTTSAVLAVSVLVVLVLNGVPRDVVLAILSVVALVVVAVFCFQQDAAAAAGVASRSGALADLVKSHGGSPLTASYLEQYGPLTDAMLRLHTVYAWIDQHAVHDVIKKIVSFVELFAISLASDTERGKSAVAHDSAQELLDLKRDIMNELSSLYVRDSAVLRDRTFRSLLRTVHASLDKMLDTLARRHNLVLQRPHAHEPTDDLHLVHC